MGGASVGRGRGKGTGFLDARAIRLLLRVLWSVRFLSSGRCLRAETACALSSVIRIIPAKAAHLNRHVIMSGSARPGSRSGRQDRDRNSPRLFDLNHTCHPSVMLSWGWAGRVHTWGQNLRRFANSSANRRGEHSVSCRGTLHRC
jgi:hypothetical protein